jgi:hypothetical protein
VQHKCTKAISLKGEKGVGKLTSGQRRCLIIKVTCVLAIGIYVPHVMMKSVTVAERSKACIVFARSEAVIVSSNPT